VSVVEPDVVVVVASDALLDDPPRTIHVNIFGIARAPVSNRDYAAFVASTAHPAPPGFGADARAAHPVEGTSWADAVAYCRWLSTSTRHVYRLPDEREWEKAARGASGRRWPWGEEDDPKRANVREVSLGATSPIGAFAAGATTEGVLDLIGNVREWTNTWADGRVLRGGSYLDLLGDCFPSHRFRATDDLRGVGFRVVRSMTGR